MRTTDAQWGQIATDFLDGVGLAPVGGIWLLPRWVAVRHAADHVHLVVTLVRQDGRSRWMRYKPDEAGGYCWDGVPPPL